MNTDAWRAFEDDLAARLPDLRDRDTISFRDGPRYVQLQQTPKTLVVEAVSNRFLPPDQRLTEAQTHALTNLGWRSPNPPGAQNWRRDYPWPIRASDARTIASVIGGTLRDVFGVAEPAQITVQSFQA